MNENTRKWIAALRSGEYVQDLGRLRNEKGFCCLGVACDIYSKETGEGGWDMETDEGGDTEYLFAIDGIFEKDFLPRKVFEWFGLSTKEGRFQHSFPPSGTLARSTLARRNDIGSSFAEIADILESEKHIFS